MSPVLLQGASSQMSCLAWFFVSPPVSPKTRTWLRRWKATMITTPTEHPLSFKSGSQSHGDGIGHWRPLSSLNCNYADDPWPVPLPLPSGFRYKTPFEASSPLPFPLCPQPSTTSRLLPRLSLFVQVTNPLPTPFPAYLDYLKPSYAHFVHFRSLIFSIFSTTTSIGFQENR